jgi:hypothetical protein
MNKGAWLLQHLRRAHRCWSSHAPLLNAVSSAAVLSHQLVLE